MIMDMTYDKINGGIAFRESDHVYFNVNNPDIKYISVTTLIEKFGKPFDKEFWSQYKALEKVLDPDYFKLEKKRLLDTKKFNKDYYLKTYNIDEVKFNSAQQDILDAWQQENQKSCERGTAIHAGFEHEFLDAGVCELKKYGLGGKFNVKSGDTPLDEEKGVYPEYLIHVDDGDLHLAGQIDLLIKDGNDIYIRDYKGLPLDTPIATPNGFTTMGDLKVGDKVFDKDGNVCNVTVKSEIHNNPCYKITLSKDFSIVADKDHRWLIHFSTHPNTKYHGELISRVMTTEELSEYLKTYNKKNQYQLPKIYINKCLDLPHRELPLDPYILGLWLGDGCKDSGRITQETNSKAWDILKQKGFDIGENSEKRGYNAETRTVYNIRGILQELGVLNNKHIPDSYLFADKNQRISLLQGIMDADGFYDKTHDRYVMSTNYKWQCDGMVKLLSSLGIKAQVNIQHRGHNKKPGTTNYDIKFKTTNFIPFLCRNQDIEMKNTHYTDFYVIKSVEPVEMVPTQCIQVDSPSHTYLCTEHLLVTHNTNKEIKTKGFFNSKTKQTEKMKYPLTDFEEANFSHYTLQLSMYAWMIEHNNPDLKVKTLTLDHFDHEGNYTQYKVEYRKEAVERLIRYWKKQGKIEERKALRKPIEF